jgi:UDP-N-acetyl-D-glucosamine dehydrogenase
MPDHVIAELGKALDMRFRKAINGAEILLIGIAYKKNVDDMRESPSLKLIEKLEARGAKVNYFDPHFPEIPMSREQAELAGRQSVTWDLGSNHKYDVVLIATDHDSVDYVRLAEGARLIVDTRNACGRAGADMSRVVLA